MTDDGYQSLNDAGPFDFSRPPTPFESLDNQRPFVVHETEDGRPEALIGNLGELHRDIFEGHDVGPVLLRGYIDSTGEPTIESGDESYLPLVEKHMEHLTDIEDWPNERTAGITDQKWGYLNGEVGFGQFHHQIIDALAQRQKMPDMQKGLLTNLALSNAHPGNIGHDVAWGQFHEGYPVFWRTNVDRNAIWDAVQNARHIVEPPQYNLAHSKEIAELDYLKTAAIGSGGQLVEVYPGDVHMSYDGDPTELPHPTTHGDHSSKFYGANVELGGRIIGSVSVEVEATTSRDGQHSQHVTLHDAWVDPEHAGSDVWIKLYRWLRSHWPDDRLFGGFANQDLKEFFERDNRQHYLGDDDAWEETGIGSGHGSNDDMSTGQPAWAPNVYAKTANAAEYDAVYPVPERNLEREGLESAPGGRYIIPSTREDVTDQVRPGGMLQIVNGKPQLHVQRGEAEPPGRAHGTLTRVNLFRQKAGWRWQNPGQEDTPTIISVEHGPKHYYALRTTFNSPLHLRTYPGKSEPHLRPTTRGDLDFGSVVNTIRLRGRDHPVYDHIEVNPRRATERIGAFGDPDQQRLLRERPAQADFSGRAPWYIDHDGNPVVGNWGQFHQQIGGYAGSGYTAKGDVDREGNISVYNTGREFSPEEQQQIAEHLHHPLRSAFGFGFHPQLLAPSAPAEGGFDFAEPPRPPSAPTEAPQSDPNGLRARLKASTLGRLLKRSEGDTELPGDYMRVGADSGEAAHLIANPSGVPHRLPNGEWASWSGWPDAYRFVMNPEGYMEQPESDLQSGHGYGHPGLKMQWKRIWPDKQAVNPATPGHVAGWHVPMRDGTRGIITYTHGETAPEAVAHLQSMIQRVHGAPTQMVDGREYLNPRHVALQHEHGNVIEPPPEWRQALGQTFDQWYPRWLQGIDAVQAIPTSEGFDFSNPAPAPR